MTVPQAFPPRRFSTPEAGVTATLEADNLEAATLEAAALEAARY